MNVVNLTTIEKSNSSRGRGECIVYIYIVWQQEKEGKERSSELNISNKDENLFELEVEVKE